jgi:protein-S-isoprenylcysteine O-methyltransferase Ste14
MHRLELKIPPVAVFLVFVALMWAIARALPAAALPVPAARIVAAVLATAGVALGVAGILAFRRHGTTVHPVHPHKASAIVSEGVYRYTRNPMYLGLALFLLAWAVWLGNFVSVACVPVFIAYMTRFQIRPEEHALLTKFGPDFRHYMESVRRWI